MQNKSILIIGNGTQISKNVNFDDFDEVLRLNNFKIDGFEHLVGTKITKYGFSSEIFIDRIKFNLEKYDINELLLYNVKNNHIFSTSSLSQKLNRKINDITDDIIIEQMNNPPNLPYASTGLVMIFYFANFSDYDVYICNFDLVHDDQLWKTDNSYYHYYETKSIKTVHRHDSKLEKKIVCDLIND